MYPCLDFILVKPKLWSKLGLYWIWNLISIKIQLSKHRYRWSIIFIKTKTWYWWVTNVILSETMLLSLWHAVVLQVCHLLEQPDNTLKNEKCEAFTSLLGTLRDVVAAQSFKPDVMLVSLCCFLSWVLLTYLWMLEYFLYTRFICSFSSTHTNIDVATRADVCWT